MLDLESAHRPIRDQILAAMTRVLDSRQFIMGEDVLRLEQELAAYCGASHAIACASGSDALFLALLACDTAPGDVVVTTPFSFFATAGAITRCGATPVFADIDPVTYNIDPAKLAQVAASLSRVKAIIPVHLFGGCADMDPIVDIGRRLGCPVIEDGAQAIGAEYNCRRALSLGEMGCLSFFPSKNLGGLGDGGLVTTQRDDLARKIAALRLHGSAQKYVHEWAGINSRMDTLQAAVLRVKLAHLDSWTQARQRNAELYREFLGSGAPFLSLPRAASYQTRHVWNQFVIRSANRDGLRDYLSRNGVASEIYYPRPLHLQPCYRSLGYRPGDFPESEKAAAEVLALPIYPGLTVEDIEYIAGLLRAWQPA